MSAYRGNETSRVGDILEKLATGDRAGALADIVDFWSGQPERRDGVDPAAIDVWEALKQGDAIEEALVVAIGALRAKRLLRAHAFIAIVEELEDQRALYELATIALDAGWPAHPHLAAILVRLAALRQDHQLWTWLLERRERFSAPTSTAICAAVMFAVITPSGAHVVPSPITPSPDVPMFAAFAQLVTRYHGTNDQLARRAADECVPDRTGAYLLARALHDLLLRRELEEFAAQYAIRGGLLVPVERDHPIIRYIDGARHVPTTFGEPGFVTLAARLHRANEFIVDCARIFRVFAKLIALPRGDRAAPALYLEMTRSYPSTLPDLQPVWGELVNARLTWFQRQRLEFIG